MSRVSTRNGRKDERHNNRRITGTLTLNYQDRKIARKNGWVFEYDSICDYLQLNFINLDYAEVRLISKELNSLSTRQNIYMSDLYGDPSEDGVFVIRLSSEPQFQGCKNAQRKIGKMVSKGRIPSIYVTRTVVNKIFSLQATNKKCHFCSKTGHLWRQCRKRNKNAPKWRYKDEIKVKQKVTFSCITDNDDWTL